MAQIVLDPGEVFEHFHDVPSTSTVMEGEVEFRIGDDVEILRPRQTKEIPAHTVHSMRNLSASGRAVMSCTHGVAAH